MLYVPFIIIYFAKYFFYALIYLNVYIHIKIREHLQVYYPTF